MLCGCNVALVVQDIEFSGERPARPTLTNPRVGHPNAKTQVPQTGAWGARRFAALTVNLKSHESK